MFCTDENLIYAISCTKSNGQCQKVHPQYIGESGKLAKWRCARHLATITNQSKSDAILPMGVPFRLPGHSHSDLSVTNIEKIHSKDSFVCKVQESYYINNFQILKVSEVEVIQHGLK